MQRRAIEIRGMVQGVGFRPYVYSLATRYGLGGFVRNRTGTVWIEVEGEARSLDQFCRELAEHPPRLARIESVAYLERQLAGDRRFSIVSSEATGPGDIFISPDMATCGDCLAELFDPSDRRYRYPFINCTHCGPRLTIVTGAPYDRQQTTMAPFEMCVPCRAEYDDPASRRFHAQASACPQCGPQLRLLDSGGQLMETPDPLTVFAGEIKLGHIGALKGIGGYHLVCDARQEQAVSTLRRRKQRNEKPLAIMATSVEAAAALCIINPEERELLVSRSAPIVLLRRRDDCRGSVAASVALNNPYLGVMLPYSPLHHLLLQATSGPLVMTSGNLSDEPIAYRDDDAIERLGNVADLLLTHDRAIEVRCDDSVSRIVAGKALPIRRSRGLAPEPVCLPLPCPYPILAVGGQLKATFSLGTGIRAFMSHHLGDLDELDANRAMSRDIALYEQLLGITPLAIAHDLHPDYASTRYAIDRDLPRLAVQHHHAHLASCMAEHGLNEPVIGIIFDGAGVGTDGAIWGGEFLIGDYRQFRRIAGLRYVGMPGGEQAVRQPWRMAVAHLLDAGCDFESLGSTVSSSSIGLVRQMLLRRCNAPFTSSMGRLFDAVSAIAGVRAMVSYEGQAAVELEWLAMKSPPDGGRYRWRIERVQDGIETYPDLPPSAGWAVDTRSLIRHLAADVAAGVPAAVIARRFHSSVVDLVTLVCAKIRAATGLSQVVLSGGVFMNALLTSEARAQLSADGFTVYCHEQTPANDGGLSLGQLAIAAATLC